MAQTGQMIAPLLADERELGIQILVAPEAFRARILAELPRDASAAEIRRLTVAQLTSARREAMARIAADFLTHPRSAPDTIRAYTALADALVTTVFAIASELLHPGEDGDADNIALLAVGGYGRGEMAPFSDIDLLFLTPAIFTDRAEQVVESMLYMLWDLKLKVGHATRTVDDCIRLGREDYTIRTALLEHRLLDGEPELAATLAQRLRDELFHGTEAEFVEAKLAERAQRHIRQGGQRYVLEPNVKEGKGGLRDLHALYWIAKYIHQVQRPAELVALGVFTPQEAARFDEAGDFLMAVRCHLHLVTGRATEVLSFDLQVDVARRMGYADASGRRAVEVFMQEYFRHATRVGEVTRIFLTALEAQHVKRAPKPERLMRRRRKVAPEYSAEGNRLRIRDPESFLADPVNFLRIFAEALRTGLLVHPDAMRLVASNLNRIGTSMRESREANRIFLDILLGHGNPERGLRRMNEIGLLGAFIPEFEPIVAMMQFNVYHHYTVDEHTIQCISTLDRLERGELAAEMPLATRIAEEPFNRRVLYVALFLHDIGKGRQEDHSILGARIARRVAPRLTLTPSESETVEWLVRNHLLMSDVAQRRDLTDPRTVRDFAKAVRTKKRLDLLALLTVCDIFGVGPGTWNNWKAQLLRQLYRKTVSALDGGLEDLNRAQRQDAARAALREALSDWDRKERRLELSRHNPSYWQELDTETHVLFARLLRGIGDDEIRIDLHPDTERDATRAGFALTDHPGIFSRLAGALAITGANVVDARTYTTKDGYAAAVFWVQDADGRPYEISRLPRLRSMIERTLRGEIVAREVLADRDRVKKRHSQFSFPTHVTFDNDGSDIYTIIEVDTRDRPGLLYDLTRTLAASSVYIASASIATYGAQVVDTFYVKDMFGLKIAGSKQQALEKKLRLAIFDGAERARR